MRKILLLLKLFAVVAAIITAQIGHAQLQRALPANAKRGITGEPRALPIVIINGTAAKLAPGGTIFDVNNRTILHQNLPANADVLFQLDMNGDIQHLYILTPEERARLGPFKK
jgi:hypothetical protein